MKTDRVVVDPFDYIILATMRVDEITFQDKMTLMARRSYGLSRVEQELFKSSSFVFLLQVCTMHSKNLILVGKFRVTAFPAARR